MKLCRYGFEHPGEFHPDTNFNCSNDVHRIVAEVDEDEYNGVA